MLVNNILSESEADKIVIKNLTKELRKKHTMTSKLLIDPETNEVYMSELHTLLSDDDLADNENDLKSKLNDVQKIRELRDKRTNDTFVPALVETGVEPLPPQAPEVAQPAPTPEAAPVSEASAPVDTTQTLAPAPELNQVQPTVQEPNHIVLQ